jgi:DNA-binding NtrC family response regulator
MRLRILIADSDAEFRKSCVASLTWNGHLVATASNGLDCIALQRDFHPQVLVLGPMLPWGWGGGVSAMMCEETDAPPVHVILVTAGSAQFPEELNLPVWGRLRKPLQPHELLTAIARCVQSRPGPAATTEDHNNDLQRLNQV